MSAQSYARWRTRRDEAAVQSRRTRDSDRPKPNAVHYLAVAWGGVPGECGAECACGVTWDGFDRIGDATELLDQHAANPFNTWPNHTARAVSIAACFPLLGRLAGGRAYHPGQETKTMPLTMGARYAHYTDQTGLRELTPRQQRRAHKKHRQAERRYEMARGVA